MSERYISHSDQPTDRKDWEAARKVVAQALFSNVEQVEKNKRTLSGGGVYIGLSGLALMESKLASMLEAGLDVPELSRENLEALADRHTSQALCAPDVFKVKSTRVSFLETNIGIVTLAILRYRTTNTGPSAGDDDWTVHTAVLDRAVRNIIHEDKEPSMANDDGCEVLYGRAGLLYAFLLLRNASSRGLSEELPTEFARQLNQLVAVDNLRVIVDSIILRGRRGGIWLREDVGATETTLPPLMWSWHQTRYLGAAHGVAGILQMLLSCPAEVTAPYMDDILNTTEWLISLQDDTGNWPSSLKLHKRHSSNELVQWCHGAPGILILLATVLKLAHRHNNPLPVDDRMKASIASALHRGANLVYRHGFLRKGLGLCHGIAGSVYALLAVADVSNEVHTRLSESQAAQGLDYLGAAVHMSTLVAHVDEFVANGEMRIPDRPWSLYEGRAGMCCALAEVLHRTQTEMSGETVRDASNLWGMPGHSDLAIEA